LFATIMVWSLFLALASLGFLLQVLSVEAFTVVDGNIKSPVLSVLTQQLQHRQGLPRKYSTLLSSSSPDASSSSVGDYVRGVHGGKYQFEDAGGATFAGQQFAEALYASTDEEDDTLGHVNEPLPKWGQTMATSAKLGTNIGAKPFENHWPVLSISSNKNNAPVTINICNDERSWEYYYCKLVQICSDGTVLDKSSLLCHELQADPKASNLLPVVITPATGHLAPRGGSSNLCDPSKPYSDSATLQVIYNSAFDASSFDETGNACLLVIGTEAETWRYWLQII